MTIDNSQKYIGIKVKGINHWIWFATKNSEITNFHFIGKGGWGKNGAFTNVDVPTEEIIGTIYSESPQY